VCTQFFVSFATFSGVGMAVNMEFVAVNSYNTEYLVKPRSGNGLPVNEFGRLKMREWKMGNIGTVLQGWKMQE